MTPCFNEVEVAQSFGKAAHSYDKVAILQREVGQRLLERLDVIRLKPTRILDLGAGTGFCTQLLESRYRHANTVSFDISFPSLQVAKEKSPWYGKKLLVNGSAAVLPFEDHCFDFIISNLMLHWCIDLESVFREIQRVLSPNGLFLFSILGPDTLTELRKSWLAVDDFPHVNPFIDMHDVGDLLLATGLADPVMDMEKMVLTYSKVEDLMKELKLLGAHNLSTQRFRGLTARSKMKKMIETYQQFRLPAGEYPATYEVVYGHAWQGPLSAGYGVNTENEVNIPLNSLRRTIR